MSEDKLYRESVVHRTGGLPMKIYDSCYVRYHWHDEYEFLLPTSDGSRCTVNGHQLVLNRGEALMIRSGELHSHCLDAGKSIIAIVVHPKFFTGEECAIFFEKLRFPSLFSDKDAVGAQVIQMLREIKDCYEDEPFGYEFHLKTLFCTLFDLLLKSGAYEICDASERRRSFPEDKLFEYVHAHFDEPFSLDTLSAHTHYSKSYIIRLFKKHTGLSPTEYINRYRVEQAKALLLSGNLSVLDVSLACGFRNVSYFIRVFSRYTGRTPAEWKKTEQYLHGVSPSLRKI